MYEKDDRIATITLNKPKRFNAIQPPMPRELEMAIGVANNDNDVRVIVLQAAGKAFCAGFDFSDDLDHFEGWGIQMPGQDWDPGQDMMSVTSSFWGPVPKLMSIWPQPEAGDCAGAWLVCGRRR